MPDVRVVPRALGWPGAVGRDLRHVFGRLEYTSLLPFGALVGVFVWAATINSSVLSYTGLDLLLASAVPLVFATLSQMVVISLGDIDLGTGYFVGLTNSVTAQILVHHAAAGVAVLAALVAAYMAIGLLIAKRGMPSIVVTLGASFVWLGLGEFVLSTPGGSEPTWLAALFSLRPPLIPLPIVMCAIGAAVAHLFLYRTRMGVVIRGAGSNLAAIQASGRNAPRVRVLAYGTAALFGIAAGLAVTGITGSGDPTGSANYTLLAIAAVILGGGEFSGGRTSATGAVAGAVTISMIGSVLGLLNVSSSLQTGAEGLVLMLVIAGRSFVRVVDR